MKYLFINVVCGIKSTGRICADLARELEKKGNIVKIAYGRDVVPAQCASYAVRIGSNHSANINATMARLFDNDGFFAINETKRFLDWADEYDPDVLWLHNLHGYYINIELLFSWIKSRPEMKVLWTLHDCWAFTGHCAYFSYVGCDKWKKQCYKCIQKKSYPKSILFDNSTNNYIKKRNAFLGVKNLTIITPSVWLANLVKDSFLGNYPIKVIHNSIDVGVFKPTSSDIRESLQLEDKCIVLGVSAVWDDRKGLKDFIALNTLLNDDYRIILIGLTPQQIISLPPGIIGIEKTNNQEELAKYYSIADVLFNPTYEDNYPTVNIEAIACGLPVISYNTGGSGESAERFGFVVEQGDYHEVLKILKNKAYSQLQQPLINYFSNDRFYEELLELL